MLLSSTTRSGGDATGLPGAMPFGVLSRRAAMLGAVTIAGFTASFPRPVGPAAAITSAASLASADAALIAHAGRIVALARRCETVVDHLAGLEDRVDDLCPGPDPLPKPPLRSFMSETPTPTGRVVHIVQDHEPDPAWVEWEDATAAVKAAHERREIDAGARLGLPEIYRRSARMDRRRDRWAADLAAMRPTTLAGLAAKASAMTALLGEDWMTQRDAVERHSALLSAVLNDAVRLGTGASA